MVMGGPALKQAETTHVRTWYTEYVRSIWRLSQRRMAAWQRVPPVVMGGRGP